MLIDGAFPRHPQDDYLNAESFTVRTEKAIVVGMLLGAIASTVTQGIEAVDAHRQSIAADERAAAAHAEFVQKRTLFESSSAEALALANRFTHCQVEDTPTTIPNYHQRGYLPTHTSPMTFTVKTERNEEGAGVERKYYDRYDAYDVNWDSHITAYVLKPDKNGKLHRTQAVDYVGGLVAPKLERPHSKVALYPDAFLPEHTKIGLFATTEARVAAPEYQFSYQTTKDKFCDVLELRKDVTGRNHWELSGGDTMLPDQQVVFYSGQLTETDR